MNLPSKNKHGRPYLSWSQISCFVSDVGEYKRRYIDRIEFEGNAYTDFGSKVGGALESGDFTGFTDCEIRYLSMCERLDLFEYFVSLKYDEFDVIGYVDTATNDLSRIMDYKTGSKKAATKYLKDNYLQLCYYALAIRQHVGHSPKLAQVQYVFRKGNAFKGEKLMVDEIEPMLIDINISEDRLKRVYWWTIEVAKKIEEFNNYCTNDN